MNPKLRQFTVNLILKFWYFMPIKAKVWAFLNDGDLVDDRKPSKPEPVKRDPAPTRPDGL